MTLPFIRAFFPYTFSNEENVMNQPGCFIVIDKDGVRGTLERLPSPQASAAGAQVTVQLENGQRVTAPARVLLERERKDGTFFLSRGFAELGTDASADLN